MFKSLIIGIGGIIFLLALWVIVQAGWREMFADQINDEDVLAERRSCANCGCKTVCKNKLKQLSTE